MRRPDQSHHVGTSREAKSTVDIDAQYRDRRFKRKMHRPADFIAHLRATEADANIRYIERRR